MHALYGFALISPIEAAMNNKCSFVSHVIDHASSGVVSLEQAQCWRLFPHGLQCHHAVPNAQGES